MNNFDLLVSGITGFVGANLKKHFSNDYNVIGIGRKANSQVISYDDLSISNFNDSKAFVHLAGKAHDLKKTFQEKEYFEVNTGLTKKMFNLFLESECEVFIFMSSVKAVADVVEGELTEEVVPNPVTAYGKSKLAAENYILSKKRPLNKRIYILRPCMIHGPNNKGNLNLLYNLVSKGIPYPFGRYQNKRSFTSIVNLCFIVNELIENSSIESGIYNIADTDFLSTNNLVKIIGQAADVKVSLWKISKRVIKLIAIMGDFLPLPINSEKLNKLTENYIVSNNKIRNALNKELPLTTEKGVTLTIKSFIK